MDTKIYASLLSDLILKPTPETDIMILILKIRQLGPREAKEPAQVYRAGLKLTPEPGEREKATTCPKSKGHLGH